MQHRSRLRVLVCIPADLPKLIYAIRPALALSIQVDPADWFARDHEFDELVRITANKLKEGFGRRGGKVAPRGTSRPETLGGFPPGKRKPRASVSTEQGLEAIIIARWVSIRVQI